MSRIGAKYWLQNEEDYVASSKVSHLAEQDGKILFSVQVKHQKALSELQLHEVSALSLFCQNSAGQDVSRHNCRHPLKLLEDWTQWKTVGSSSWGLQNSFRSSKILEILICRHCTSSLKCGNDFKDLMIPAKASIALLQADASRNYILQINKCFTRLHPPINT